MLGPAENHTRSSTAPAIRAPKRARTASMAKVVGRSEAGKRTARAQGEAMRFLRGRGCKGRIGGSMLVFMPPVNILLYCPSVPIRGPERRDPEDPPEERACWRNVSNRT